ncbi:MAG: hypothetical protein IPL46_20630 [Saprospiraceae bacterium]|nr:hypothetical protein [Saprospiraceae bacterium]
MLNIEKILTLAETNNPTCISIYMSTSKKGMNVLNSEDQLEFKATIRQIEKEIGSRFKTKREVHDFLVPLYELVMDKEFWRNQQQGLAVFYSNQGLHRFRLPLAIAKRHVVSNQFILWPLIEVVPTQEQSFYLLTLGLDDVHLYAANPFKMKKVLKNKLNQLSLEDTVGSDFEEKQLQFHSQKSGFTTAIYHGRGEGKDDVKSEILKYYRSVNDVVMTKLKDKKVPLLLSGLDHLVGLYKRVNKYSYVHEKHLTGNPEDCNEEALH